MIWIHAARLPVAPLAGAWIEMHGNYLLSPSALSLPSRERGLKYVTVGCCDDVRVAPLAGAWIEIPLSSFRLSITQSLPSRERGLKYRKLVEIFEADKGRSPRGSVD